MKICKFCRKSYKSAELKKRTVKLPTGLPITSLDPMCKSCYNILKSQEFRAANEEELSVNLETNDNTSRNSHTREVEGTISETPTVEGQ